MDAAFHEVFRVIRCVTDLISLFIIIINVICQRFSYRPVYNRNQGINSTIMEEVVYFGASVLYIAAPGYNTSNQIASFQSGALNCLCTPAKFSHVVLRPKLSIEPYNAMRLICFVEQNDVLNYLRQNDDS